MWPSIYALSLGLIVPPFFGIRGVAVATFNVKCIVVPAIARSIYTDITNAVRGCLQQVGHILFALDVTLGWPAPSARFHGSQEPLRRSSVKQTSTFCFSWESIFFETCVAHRVILNKSDTLYSMTSLSSPRTLSLPKRFIASGNRRCLPPCPGKLLG